MGRIAMLAGVAIFGWAAGGCSGSVLVPEGALSPSAGEAEVQARVGEPFRLRAGEVASVAEAGLVVGFRGVVADSRCPVDVQCVWAGDAEVAVGVARAGGGWVWRELHTGLEPHSTRFEGYTLELVTLDPAPSGGSEIEQRDYRVGLRVDRL